jgi:hypothetical protein
MLARRTLHALVMAMLFQTLSACVSLPSDYPRTASSAIQDTGATRLGRGIEPLVAAHPDQSGFYPLPYGVEAFVARLALAEAAEKSLDVQYYIWHDDQTGKLLTEGLLRAAVELHEVKPDASVRAHDEHGTKRATGLPGEFLESFPPSRPEGRARPGCVNGVRPEWHLLKRKTTETNALVIPANAGIQAGVKTTGFPHSRE